VRFKQLALAGTEVRSTAHFCLVAVLVNRKGAEVLKTVAAAGLGEDITYLSWSAASTVP